MRRALKLLNQNCRLATQLVSEAQDRPLDGLEKTGLTIHLAGCTKCRRYRQQIKMLEQVVKTAAETDTSVDILPPAARQKIRQKLIDAAYRI
jgi:predicted anti-sigma-YlaC factor YlaD